jgi:hypothetical protein
MRRLECLTGRRLSEKPEYHAVSAMVEDAEEKCIAHEEMTDEEE